MTDPATDWQPRRQVHRPIRTRRSTGTCPACTRTDHIIERADYDYEWERWRVSWICAWCLTRWSDWGVG